MPRTFPITPALPCSIFGIDRSHRARSIFNTTYGRAQLPVLLDMWKQSSHYQTHYLHGPTDQRIYKRYGKYEGDIEAQEFYLHDAGGRVSYPKVLPLIAGCAVKSGSMRKTLYVSSLTDRLSITASPPSPPCVVGGSGLRRGGRRRDPGEGLAGSRASRCPGCLALRR